ncbi:MAG: hypothetical protein KatS3mg105_1636 [Gemmatales bacterium]|nr:MAG: hypothetical protein KatS3mg105_1636 [Gemmatales bacterium]
MTSHYIWNGCSPHLKDRLSQYWSKKVRRIERVLTPYRPDLVELRLTFHRHSADNKGEWFEGRAVVHLPTGTVVAEANEKDGQVVLDRIADTLVRDIKRHKEQVRKDYVFKRKVRAREDLSAAGPYLERDREVGRKEDFFQLLRPQLRFLADHARRELRILELEGVLHANEVSVADVLDEVLTRAWQQFPDRPKQLSLDLWLTSLLHDVLEACVKQEPRPHASLEERVETAEEGEEEWWASLLGYDESLSLEELVADSEAFDAWNELEAEERNKRVLSLVADLPAAQRQAFLLQALEDYDIAEIAMLQDRPESEVKADIEKARQILKEKLTAEVQPAS